MVVGDLLEVQDGMVIAAVLHRKALHSHSQALETKTDQQQSNQEEAAHSTSLPERFRPLLAAKGL